MSINLTIGIPTYKRPDLLQRALESFIHESINDELKIFVLISVDGIDNTYKDYKILEEKLKNYKFVNFIFHKKNLGSLNNFYFLRDNCETEYFMWLADDDEINFKTIKKLYNVLKTSKAITIVPSWEKVNEDKKRKIIIPRYFDDDNLIKRIFKYCYDSDDAFFYGLHKTKYLKNCDFKDYWWPNKKILSNWCYVFQFDLVIQGKIIYLNDTEFKWINHDYGEKYYPKATSRRFVRNIAYTIRCINIYYLYLKKILKWKKYLLIPILVPFFLILLLRDLIFEPPIYKRVRFEN